MTISKGDRWFAAGWCACFVASTVIFALCATGVMEWSWRWILLPVALAWAATLLIGFAWFFLALYVVLRHGMDGDETGGEW